MQTSEATSALSSSEAWTIDSQTFLSLKPALVVDQQLLPSRGSLTGPGTCQKLLLCTVSEPWPYLELPSDKS